MNQAKAAGVLIACAGRGINPSDFTRWQSEEKLIADSPHDRANLGRTICKVAAEVYRGAGLERTLECQMFALMEKSASWPDAYDGFARIVTEAIGALEDQRMSEHVGEVEKVSSAGLGGLLLGHAGRLASLTPSALQFLMAAGSTAGIGAGGLAWMANRHANEDDVDIEQDQQKADYYRRLARDISRKLEAEGGVPVSVRG